MYVYVYIYTRSPLQLVNNQCSRLEHVKVGIILPWKDCCENSVKEMKQGICSSQYEVLNKPCIYQVLNKCQFSSFSFPHSLSPASHLSTILRTAINNTYVVPAKKELRFLLGKIKPVVSSITLVPRNNIGLPKGYDQGRFHRRCGVSSHMKDEQENLKMQKCR